MIRLSRKRKKWLFWVKKGTVLAKNEVKNTFFSYYYVNRIKIYVIDILRVVSYGWVKKRHPEGRGVG